MDSLLTAWAPAAAVALPKTLTPVTTSSAITLVIDYSTCQLVTACKGGTWLTMIVVEPEAHYLDPGRMISVGEGARQAISWGYPLLLIQFGKKLSSLYSRLRIGR